MQLILRLTPTIPVTYTINNTRYASILQNEMPWLNTQQNTQSYIVQGVSPVVVSFKCNALSVLRDENVCKNSVVCINTQIQKNKYHNEKSINIFNR